MSQRFMAVVAISFLAACTNFSQEFGGWVGYHVDELVMRWGPPNASYQMRDGGSVISYSAQEYFSVEGPGIPVPFDGTYWCEVTFTADANGYITSWDRDGNLGGCNSLVRRTGGGPAA